MLSKEKSLAWIEAVQGIKQIQSEGELSLTGNSNVLK